MYTYLIDHADGGGRDCRAGADDGGGGRRPVWSDEHWRLSPAGPSGSPLILLPQA